MNTRRVSAAFLAFVCLVTSDLQGATNLAAKVSVKINFQTASASVPAGYSPDTGQVYGLRGNGLTYGWNKDNRANARNRNSLRSPDQRYDTLIYLRRGDDSFQWELGIPNGTYRVRVVAGDPSEFNSVYGIDVEGVKAVSGSPNSSIRWLEGTVTVRVTDGRLTVTNRPETKENKICFIEVGPEGVANLPPKVDILSPSNGAMFASPTRIEIVALATAREGRVKSVEFFEGTKSLGVVAANPMPMLPISLFRLSWTNPPAGAYTLTAKATDTAGNTATSPPIKVTVASAQPKETSLVITSPADGASFAPLSTITIKATAIDPNGYINRVEFYTNDVRAGTSEIIFIRAPDAGEPIYHSFDWKRVEAGIYTLTARAKDSKGITVVSRPVKINVQPGLVAGFVSRQLPAGYSPGVPLMVELQANPSSGTKVYAVEEQLPVGWTNVSKITHDGVYDPASGKVKFGPFFDSTARTLSYTVTPPAGASGEKIFNGSVSVDGRSSPIGGANRTDSILLHPADNNPANAEMSLDEVTAYGAAWRSGDRWPVAPNPIPISYVTRAGALWRGGEAYAYDPKSGPLPNAWVNISKPAPRTEIGKQSVEPASAGAEAEGFLSFSLASGPCTRMISVRPPSQVLSQAVEDRVQENLSVSQISHGGVFDATNWKVKWGPFDDSVARTLTYQVTVSGAGINALVFEGVASFDGVDIPVNDSFPLDLNINAAASHLKSILRLPGGDVELRFAGEAGQSYVIEATDNLTDWKELTTVTVDMSAIRFVDREGPERIQRFYRIRRATSDR